MYLTGYEDRARGYLDNGKKGTKHVKIAALNDKRLITAVFACSLLGKFFPIQLVYKGTTSKCLPKNVNFPKDWDITCTENHWSNESTTIDYLVKIVIPYVQERRRELKLSVDHPALTIFNVFKGQCTERVFKMLEDHNILCVIIPSNCTDILQPLYLSVNKSAKDFMKSKFQEWYGGIIHKQLEDQIEEEVNIHLSVMKLLTAGWIIDFITT